MANQPRIIQNQYQLLNPLGDGVGGMGVVYRATDLTLDRDVAIKMIRPELLDNADMEKRFQREAKALARLNHPNIANIYNFCRDGDEYCLIMEFVSGQNLAERLNEQGSLPQQEAIRLVVQALRGLSHAHSRGVLHRDLKPANLMLTADGTVKILDFGIAKLADAPATQTTLNSSLTGTVRYMAPELLDQGQPSPQSDLYALNLVLYELLTGRAAFRAPTLMRLMAQIANELPPPLRIHLPHAPEALENLMNRMMAKQPADRLPTAAAFADALTAIDLSQAVSHVPQKTVDSAEGTPVSAVHPVRMPVAERAETKEPVVSAPTRPRGLLVGAILGFVLLSGGIWYWLARSDKSASQVAENQTASGLPVTSLPAAKSITVSGMPPLSESQSGSVRNPEVAAPPVTLPAEKPSLTPVKPRVAANVNAQPRLPEPKVSEIQSPKPTEFPTLTRQTIPVATKEETPAPKPVDKPAESVVAKPERPKASVSVSRQTTLRLTPIMAYRAGQLSRGDVVQFAVSAESGPLSGVTARAVVSEVQAGGELATRSYIFLKRMVLETGSETIKLNLASSEPEIRFDARQTDAVIGPLLMRPSKAFTVD